MILKRLNVPVEAAVAVAVLLLIGAPAISSEMSAAAARQAAESRATEFVRCAAVGDMACVSAMVKSSPVSLPDVVNTSEPRHSMTALFAAAANGHTKLIQFLLYQGAQPDKADRRGQTALSAAAYGGHVEVVKVLLVSGANVNVRPTQGPTPLLAAMQSGKVELVGLMVQHGADIAFRDAYGMTPSKFAIHSQRPDMLRTIEMNPPAGSPAP
jgi:uncharacterized protein